MSISFCSFLAVGLCFSLTLPCTVHAASGTMAMALPSFNGCGNFVRPPVPDLGAFRSFAPSVLRLTVSGSGGTTTGTAYLIDSEQGYALTAEHVVAAAVVDGSASIFGTSIGLPGSPIKFRVVDYRDDSAIDIALLQAQPNESLASLAAFDITLRPPAPGNFFAMGYPIPPPELISTAAIPSPKQVTLNVPDYKTGMMETTQAEFDGVSGSPLIDSEGGVVGTCKDRIASNRGLYVMLLRGLDVLLRNVGMTKRMAEFDATLRDGSLNPDYGIFAFTPGLKRFSNLELLSWAWNVHSSPDVYKSHRAFFSCPAVPAFADRGLLPALSLILDLADEATQAHTLLQGGQLAAEEGKVGDAQSSYASALPLLKKAINKRIAENPAGIANAACTSDKAAQSLRSLAREKSWLRLPSDAIAGNVPCQLAATDPYLGNLFQDYSALALSLAKVSEKRTRDQWLQDATTAAGLSVLTHSDEIPKAIAYTLLGDSLRERKKNADANSAYSWALHLVFKSSVAGQASIPSPYKGQPSVPPGGFASAGASEFDVSGMLKPLKGNS
jgi:Trypsin-like peptidase domain